MAAKAAARNTGARGLRSIMESIMLDLMYIVPSRAEKLKKILVTKETVEDGAHPVEIRKDDKEVA